MASPTFPSPALRRAGVALDIWLNTHVFRGRPGESISVHADRARTQGNPVGCLLCWFLSIVVQPKHCSLAFAGVATPPAAALRAGVLLLLLTGALVAGVLTLARVLLGVFL